ncbi:MAG: hypothetical protein WKG07_13205 [Hymenobacter sp.]
MVLVLGVALVYAVVNSQRDEVNKSGASAKDGLIEVKTDPAKASILLDGKEQKQKSDTKLKAPVGQHKVLLKLAGYDDQEIIVNVTTDRPALAEHTFTKGGVSVQAAPPAGQQALRTYTNAKAGYSVQYPFDWRVETDPGGTPHFYSAAVTKQFKESAGEGDFKNHEEEQESLSVLVLPNPKNLGPQAWYEAREEFAAEDQSQIQKQPVSLGNGQPAYRYSTPYGFVPYTITVVTGKGNAYLVQQRQSSPDRQVYDGIAKSFKLL